MSAFLQRVHLKDTAEPKFLCKKYSSIKKTFKLYILPLHARSDEYDEKMKLGLKEVEPLEDLDLTKADVDLSMLLWKAVKQLGQQRYDKPEKDKDDLYHPYEAKLTVDNELPDTFIQAQARLHQEPEEDMDELFHSLFDHSEPEKPDEETNQVEEPAETGAGSSERLVYMSPEEDKDDLYHGHIPSGNILENQVMQAFENILKRIYSEPEEDLDKLYHK